MNHFFFYISCYIFFILYKNKVLFPIMIVMFLVGILRHNITSLLSVNSNMGLLDVKER